MEVVGLPETLKKEPEQGNYIENLDKGEGQVSESDLDLEEDFGQLCLICLAPGQVHSLRNTFTVAKCWSPGFSTVDGLEEFPVVKEGRCLNDHLCSLFILRNLLSLPGEECGRLLERTRVDPGSWFSICGNCSRIVQKGLEIHWEMEERRRKFQGIQDEMKWRLKESLEWDKGTAEEEVVKSVHQLIRECCRELGIVSDVSRPRHLSKRKLHLKSWKASNRPKRKRGIRDFEPPVDEGVRGSLLESDWDNNDSTDMRHWFSEEDPEKDAEECMNGNVGDMVSGQLANRGDWGLGGGEDGDGEPLLPRRRLKSKSKRVRQTRSVVKNKVAPGGSTPKQSTSLRDFSHFKSKKKWKVAAYNCKICGIPNNNSTALRRHLKDHSNPDCSDFRCPKCKYIGRSMVMVYKHCRDFHKERHPEDPGKTGDNFTCSKCNYWTTELSHFRRHNEAHEVTDNFIPIEGSDLIRCGLCGLEESRKNMFKHIREIHNLGPKVLKSAQPRMDEQGNPIRYVCDQCNKTFICENNLKGHIRHVHEGRKRFYCETCGKGFMEKEVFEDHVAIHQNNGANAYFCDQCLGTFSRRRYLRDHLLKYHSGDATSIKDGPKPRTPRKEMPPPITCKYCGLSVLHAQALTVHYRAEHKELFVYKCDQCDASYLHNMELNKHKKSMHTGTVSTCDCGMQFRCIALLKRHQRYKKHSCGQNQGVVAEGTLKISGAYSVAGVGIPEADVSRTET